MRGWKTLCFCPLVVGLSLVGSVAAPAAPARLGVSTLATPAQLLLERLSERLAASSAVQAEAANVTALWERSLAGKLGTVNAQNRALLAPAIQELSFASAQEIADSDPYHPAVLWQEAPPHTWFGNAVPGGRYAADNPDNVYRIIPIDGVSIYQIDGRFVGPRPSTTLFQVTKPPAFTPIAELGTNINGTDTLAVKRDGSFTINVGPGPANGRSNYMQSNSAATQVFVRDTLGNWSTENAPILTVRRLSGPAAPPPRTFNQLVASTVTQLTTWGNVWINYIVQIQLAPTPNTIPAPISTPDGIWRTFANFDLAANQALVVTTNPAGAAYFGIPVGNIWTVSADYWDHQSSLTSDQAVPNPDGTYTFVVSSEDPGVYNWVDTTRLRQGTFLIRWQGVPAPNVPSITSQVVDLSNLGSLLPPSTRMVTPHQRADQLAQREAAFDRRVAPGVGGIRRHSCCSTSG